MNNDSVLPTINGKQITFADIQVSANELCEFLDEKYGDGPATVVGSLYKTLRVKDLTQILGVTQWWEKEDFGYFFEIARNEGYGNSNWYTPELEAFIDGVILRYEHKFIKRGIKLTTPCFEDMPDF